MEIAIGYSGIAHGNMGLSFGNEKEVIANREGYLNFMGMPFTQTAFMNPQHGDVIKVVTKENLKKMSLEGFKCDGLFTTDKDIALAFPPADCLAIYFYNKNFSAIIHVGKDGFIKDIVQKSIAIFIIRRLISPKDKVKVVIGPYIKECCYVFPTNPHYFTKWAQKLYKHLNFSIEDNFCIDLGDAVKNLLSGKIYSSLIDGKIAVINQCTCCTNDHRDKSVYYSHVKSNDKKRFPGLHPEGRNLAVIARN